MDRRSFIRGLIGGVAAAAAVRTFPFRVFSFPTAPIVAAPRDYFAIDWPITTRGRTYGTYVTEVMRYEFPWKLNNGLMLGYARETTNET